MLRLTCVTFFLAAIAMVLALSQSDADGCAAVPREGHDYIRIAEEGAIIVWDPVQKIEHFIRRAAFDTKSPDFGFLVPTPGPQAPILKEVEDDLFQAMDRWILPRHVVKERYTYTPMSLLCCGSLMPMAKMSMEAGAAKKDGVNVLAEQKVGGFETATLQAEQTEDLSNWLKKNGYSSDPELQSWLVPYVAEKWLITAFKIMQEPKTGGLAKTKPVRMSFATDKPFFPYREPTNAKEKDKHHGSRLLRVHFISMTRMDGTLGSDTRWKAHVPWSDELTDEQRKQVAKETGLSEDELPAKAWMTTFEDRSSPRPGADEVFFRAAGDKTQIRPPDIITFKDTLWIPLDVVLIGTLFLLVGLAALLAKWNNNRRKANAAKRLDERSEPAG